MTNLVPSIEKMDVILTVIAESRQGVSFMEIVHQTKLNKSTIYSILNTLENLNYISKNDKKNYVIDYRLAFLGSKYSENSKYIELFDRFGNELVEQVNETCQLSILKGGNICYLAKVESKSNIRIKTEPGQMIPAYATAMGKVLLSDLPNEELYERLGEPPFKPLTRKTVQTMDELIHQIQFGQQNGYVLERGETEEGLFCIAAPIFNHKKEMIAAVSVTALDVYYDSKSEVLKEAVLNLARNISSNL